ncbi:MAG: prepilin-type N-terminal cleavage/methylation domain-containing protein [Candidatus Aureabacteria bacterium]|nr:prepilin-type N-terminal cleavage/methylation domain-containing protein [Candidatus Auribacterota bacterium]
MKVEDRKQKTEIDLYCVMHDAYCVEKKKTQYSIRTTHDEGFTLIELIIAVLIAALVVSAVYGSFQAGLNSWKNAQFKIELYQNARVALEQMSKEIRGGFISDKNSYYKFIGKDAAYRDRDADVLDFISTSSGLDGLCEIGYFINDDLDSDVSNLERRCDSTPDDEFLEGGTTDLLAMFVVGLNFKYFDGEEWKDSWVVDENDEDESWEAEDRCLPKAIEITLSIQNPEVQQKPLIFSTMVSIPTSTISLEEEIEE